MNHTVAHKFNRNIIIFLLCVWDFNILWTLSMYASSIQQDGKRVVKEKKKKRRQLFVSFLFIILLHVEP